MTRLLTATLLVASFSVVADDLKTFSNGQVINADDFNHNFQKLEQDIANGVTGPQGPKGDKGDTGDQGPAGADGVAAGLSCTTDQIIKWDGTNDVWVCATDPFAGLNCNVGDQLRMGSSGWECRAEPITASLIQNSWDDQDGIYAPISTYFDSFNNVETNSYCDSIFCFIEVIGVVDHSSCVVQVTGGAVSGNATVNIDTTPLEIRIHPLFTWNEGQAVYINISCTP